MAVLRNVVLFGLESLDNAITLRVICALWNASSDVTSRARRLRRWNARERDAEKHPTCLDLLTRKLGRIGVVTWQRNV